MAFKRYLFLIGFCLFQSSSEYFQILHPQEQLWKNFLFKLFLEPKKVSPKIIYVLTTQSSLQKAEKQYDIGWPWPREIYGNCLDFLRDSGAKVILFDSVFTEKSIYDHLKKGDDIAFAQALQRSPNTILGSIFTANKDNILQRSKKKAKQLRKKYTKQYSVPKVAKLHFAKFVQKYKADFSLTSSLHESEQTLTNIILNRNLQKHKQLSMHPHMQNFYIPTIKQDNTYIEETMHHIPPHDILFKSTHQIGNTAMGVHENIVHHVVPITKYFGFYIPSMIVAGVMAYLDIEQIQINQQQIELLDKTNKTIRSIPLDSKGQMHLKFYGTHAEYKVTDQIDVILLRDILDHAHPKYSRLPNVPAISKKDLYLDSKNINFMRKTLKDKNIPYRFSNLYPEKNVQPEMFKDKIVIIADGIPGHFDIKATFLNPYELGAHTIATGINNILNSDVPKPVSMFWNIFLIWLLPFILHFGKHSLFKIILSHCFVILSLLFLNILFVTQWNYLMNFMNIQLTVFVHGIVCGGFQYFYLVKDKQYIQNTFKRYLSPTLIDQIIQNKEQVQLGGVHREISIFFSDISQFTSFCETRTPEVIVKNLNDYYTQIVRYIHQNQGTLDKFEGDAAIAFWGAPIKLKEHAKLSCTTALEIQKFIMDYRKQQIENPNLLFYVPTKISIITGEALVGNIGAKTRMDYTMIGDNVNATSRILNLNKFYGTNVLIARSTFLEIDEFFDTRKVSQVLVPGKKQPIHLHELLNRKNQTPNMQAMGFELFEQGLTHYENADFSRAMALFSKANSHFETSDFLTNLYTERCKNLLKLNQKELKSWKPIDTFLTK